MKPVSRQKDAELRYNIKDCLNAISVNPDNLKVPQYFDEKCACENELFRRSRIQVIRHELKDYGFDPLKNRNYYGRKQIRASNLNPWKRDLFFVACFDYGYMKLHKI